MGRRTPVGKGHAFQFIEIRWSLVDVYELIDSLFQMVCTNYIHAFPPLGKRALTNISV
jgi:hypothetical protein